MDKKDGPEIDKGAEESSDGLDVVGVGAIERSFDAVIRPPQILFVLRSVASVRLPEARSALKFFARYVLQHGMQADTPVFDLEGSGQRDDPLEDLVRSDGGAADIGSTFSVPL